MEKEYVKIPHKNTSIWLEVILKKNGFPVQDKGKIKGISLKSRD